ncbi:MAG: amidophosphoribosyltransferase [Candidatus Micrarchaeota archaeon]
MCGIIGAIGTKDVAPDLYAGLIAMQHRGQDSAGMAVFDGAHIENKKSVGYVEDIFDSETLADLCGRVGIGHVRYATIGSNPYRDAQPFSVSEPCGIAMAHNGNVINYDELRQRYSDRARSNCDIEIVLHRFADALSREKTIDPRAVFLAVEAVMNDVNGSYSVVAFVKGGLLAFRDPHGIKPLVMGEREDGTKFFASESVAFDAIGAKIVRDVAPGEAVYIDSSGAMHSRMVKPEKPAHCMFEWVYFARPDSTIDGRNVYDARLRLGQELAKLVEKDDLDVIVPVPDTARTAAQSLAEEIKVPCREGLMKNRYIGRTFIMPTQAQRERAVRTKLNPLAFVVKDKNIGLVDDSIVRGTTSKKIVSLLKKETKRVHLIITCPPIRHPCFYGIDFPSTKELIASGRTEKQVCEHVGCDELTYLSIEGMKRAIGVDGLCMACLNGEYPTQVTDEDKRRVCASREQDRVERG